MDDRRRKASFTPATFSYKEAEEEEEMFFPGSRKAAA